jgi:fumarate reductase subunit D
MRLLLSLSILFCLALGAVHSFQLLGAGCTHQYQVVRRNFHGGAQSQHLQAPPLTTVAATAAEPPSSEPWIKPRLHNNPLVRSAVLLAALVLTGLSSPFGKLPSTTLASIHLLSFGTWFGTVFYTTFIAGLTMFKALPRQTFGKLQSKLFPKYFALSSIAIVLQVRAIYTCRL